MNFAKQNNGKVDILEKKKSRISNLEYFTFTYHFETL